MIEEYIRIHDKFSIEMKMGFTAQQKSEANDFTVNLWMFIPNSLNINRHTYSKRDFYRDMKSNIRLITPIFPLRDIAGHDALPLRLLRETFRKAAANPSPNNLSEYETHIKMFQSIVKSALRNEMLRIKESHSDSDCSPLVDSYIAQANKIAEEYRKLRSIVDVPGIQKKEFEYFLFGDEFMSNTIELHAFRVLKLLKSKRQPCYDRYKDALLELIRREIRYKKDNAYPSIEKEDPGHNHLIVSRFNTLKRYMESQLFLKVNMKEDGAFVRQFYYSVAAGISMIFATVIAFSFQMKYGNFTLPLFIALVAGYMLKDRIKELSRFYFSHKLESKYFDNKTDISFNETPIGWYKESQSFIKESQVPAEVMQLRNRSAIMEAENRMDDEKIILYRTMMQLNRKDIDESNVYPISGVNNILRLNLIEFARMMDNPHIPLYVLDEESDYRIVDGEKVYYLNFILRFKYRDQVELKRYRLSFNREGIQKLEKF